MQRHPLLWCLILGLLLLMPPLRPWLESTMWSHMLLHIPAFVLLGWWAAHTLVVRHPRVVEALRPLRWGMLITAMFSLGIWMIPRLMDLAAEQLWVDVIKALSLSLTGGLFLHLAWRHTGAVLRGLIHVEAIATLLRLGWIYAESPARLCNRYGLNDQASLGTALLWIGALYATTMAWRALHGPHQSRGDLSQAHTHTHAHVHTHH